MRKRWQSLVLRAAIATAVAWILATAPLPTIAPHTWFEFIQVPVVIFLLICYIGKLLVDTFFYNRYRP